MDFDPAVWALVEELIVKEINGHSSGADGRTFQAANDGHRRIRRR
jgi:hypothetical protein